MNTTCDLAQLPTCKSLPEALARHAATIGEKPVYEYVPPNADSPQRMTFRELHDSAHVIAAALIGHGLQRRNVLLLYPPGLDFIRAFFGCMYASVSAIPMYVPPRQVPDVRLRAIAATLQISAILTVAAKHKAVAGITAELFGAAQCQVLCTDALQTTRASEESPQIDPDAPPLIQFTSGSTSKPKGVMVSHANIMANQRMITRAFGHRGGETVVSWLPFFHDMGLIGSVMHPIFAGGRSILMSPADFLQNPHKWLQLISRYRADTSGAPNFAYDYCAARVTEEQLDGLDLSSWTVAYNGSEMIRPATMQRFSRRFIQCGFRPHAYLHCYGLAEATLYVASKRGVEHLHEALGSSADSVASVGRADEESHVCIVAESGEELPEGRTGEIWVSGPHIALGYVNDAAATGATFQARLSDSPGRTYLRTGDLGYMQGGELYVVGRLKNVIVVNGRNYYGEEIEYFVARSDEYFLESGSCITQVNEGLSQHEIVFFQEIRKTCFEAARADLQRLEDKAMWLKRQILEHFNLAVHRFVYLRENRLPRTSSGKIDRTGARDFVGAAGAGCLLEVQTR